MFRQLFDSPKFSERGGVWSSFCLAYFITMTAVVNNQSRSFKVNISN